VGAGQALGAREMRLDASDLGALARRFAIDRRRRDRQRDGKKRKEIREGVPSRHGSSSIQTRPVGGGDFSILPRISRKGSSL